MKSFLGSKYIKPGLKTVGRRCASSAPKDGFIYVNKEEPSMDFGDITGI